MKKNCSGIFIPWQKGDEVLNITIVFLSVCPVLISVLAFPLAKSNALKFLHNLFDHNTQVKFEFGYFFCYSSKGMPCRL
jgi:hypothetical protein